MTRFLTWLTRPQFTAIACAAWFAVGTLATYSLPQWALLVIAAAIGAGQVILTRLATLLLRRRNTP